MRKLEAFFISVNHKFKFMKKKEIKPQEEKHHEVKPQVVKVIKVKSPEIKLEEMKAQLKTCVVDSTPEDFIDFITTDLIKDPLITEEGSVYARDSIYKWLDHHERSPLTGSKLKKDQLLAAPILKEILEDFEVDKQFALINIDETTSPADMKILNQSVTEYLERIKGYTEKFENARFGYKIKLIKNRLLLDISTPSHLEFWDEQSMCCDFGLVKVPCLSEVYKISEPVYHVLQAAQLEYKSVSDFRKAIDVARHAPISNWSRLWGLSPKTRLVLRNNFLEQDLKVSTHRMG